MSSEDYRLGYREAREVILRRLAEPAPGRIQLLTGPRQVGKTTLARRVLRRRDEARDSIAYQVTLEETRDVVDRGVRVVPASRFLAALV